MAPILIFTSYYVWIYLPEGCITEESVHMSGLPEIKREYMDIGLSERWERLIAIKEEISKSIEEARAKKEIGHSLDAEVSLFIEDGDLFEFLSSYKETLRTILIVSSVMISRAQEPTSIPDIHKTDGFPGLGIKIMKVKGQKCERCWQYSQTVGEDSMHPSLCKRCRAVIVG